MIRKLMGVSLAALAAVALAAPLAQKATAQGANEQFLPALVYRTGPYAPNGIPFANGVADYWTMINERDGGINGVKIAFEECETGYATDKGVECYERLKGKGATGAGYFSPLSTGITFALTEKAPGDKIPLLTTGYGRSESRDGSVFTWNFPAVGTYWTAADIAIQHIAKEVGGMDNLKGKKISLVYHDSPYGKEPIAVLEARAKLNGFEFKPIAVTHPGVEQKSQWLAIRQDKPDYVLLWGWGVMNSTSIKEAAAVAFPREKIIGVWWSGAEPDVTPAGDQATGYKALMLHHGAGKFKIHEDMEKHVISKGKTQAKPEEFGQVLYNRGLMNSMIGTEAIRTAQKKFGNKPLTGEQVRWGLENLELSEARIKELGFEGMVLPMKFSCANHEGGTPKARVQQWDGKAWKIISDWYTADDSILGPMVKATATKYGEDKKLVARDCSKEQG
jgi:branched-chain amino acid transport system substrate-binding protein